MKLTDTIICREALVGLVKLRSHNTMKGFPNYGAVLVDHTRPFHVQRNIIPTRAFDLCLADFKKIYIDDLVKTLHTRCWNYKLSMDMLLIGVECPAAFECFQGIAMRCIVEHGALNEISSIKLDVHG